MLLSKGIDLITEPLRRRGDLKGPWLATLLPMVCSAALVHRGRHHGETTLPTDIDPDARFARRRDPAYRRPKE